MAPLSPTLPITGSQRRRRASSAAKRTPTPTLNLQEPNSSKGYLGASSGLSADGFAQPLPPIPGTPGHMSLSRSPSPNKGGGWSSPGLTTPFDNVSGRSTPRKSYPMNGTIGGGDVSWATAKSRSDQVNGYPSFSTRNNGFFSRHARQISRSLPSFVKGAEKEKLGRGRWYANSGTRTGRTLRFLGHHIWRLRLRLLVVLSFVLAIIIFYVTREFSSRDVLGLANKDCSHASSISKSVVVGRRQQVRHHPRSKPRRRSYGVERGSRMGYRTRQRQE